MSDLSDLNVPFDKVIEIVSEQLNIAKDDICIALEKATCLAIQKDTCLLRGKTTDMTLDKGSIMKNDGLSLWVKRIVKEEGFAYYFSPETITKMENGDMKGTRISKAEFYNYGGLSNPDLARRHTKSGWLYYRLDKGYNP